jgi:formamidopyrimidine-DNA glycosylase
MPELPDLKVYAENIGKLILGKKNSDVRIFSPKSIDCDENTLGEAVKGDMISEIYAEGKELFIRYENGNEIAIHLMLNGKCYYLDSSEAGSQDSKIMGMYFDDGKCLMVTDFQSFCKISLNPPKNDVPDVLSYGFTKAYFMEMAEKYKRKKIKSFLLDQKIMRGIGNAYADEILWKAKISPKSITGKIPQVNLELLFFSIKGVMLWAISQIKQINPDIINGEERKFMRVHNPRLKFTRDRERIHIETISSKKTYYTDSQVHYY